MVPFLRGWCLPLGAILGPSHSSSENHRCHRLCQSQHQHEPGEDLEAGCGRVFSHLPGAKILTSISWPGAEKPPEVLKTEVASFFWWGLSALTSWRSWAPKSAVFYVSVLNIVLRGKQNQRPPPLFKARSALPPLRAGSVSSIPQDAAHW